MKKMLTSLVIMIIILVVAIPAFAEDKGIHGEVSFKYELGDNCPGQSWKMDLHYNFVDWFIVGASQTTGTDGYNTYFDSVPAFVPDSQLYEFYIQSNVGDNVTIKLAQWCNHPVFSNQDDMRTQIYEGIYLEASYKF